MNKNQIQNKMSAIRGWHSEEEEKKAVLRTYAKSLGYTEDVTGDVCNGDTIMFARATFCGSRRRPRYDGDEIITGTVVNDSYGSRKQQHTFTLRVRGQGKLLIKGRNLYSIGVFAKPRTDEDRKEDLDEKHRRGSEARKLKQRIRDARNEHVIESHIDLTN